MDKINQIVDTALISIESAVTTKEIEDIRVKYLGKSGEITSLNKMMRDLPQEQKPIMGQKINEAKNKVVMNLEKQEKENKIEKAIEVVIEVIVIP